MPNAPRIPAELTQLLSRQALSDYALTCAAAEIAAERCAAAASLRPDALDELRARRSRVIAAEHALSLVVDDLATHQPSELSLDGRHHEQITTLAGTALDQLCTNLEASEQDILTAAATIQRLRTLLNELSFAAGS